MSNKSVTDHQAVESGDAGNVISRGKVAFGILAFLLRPRAGVARREAKAQAG